MLQAEIPQQGHWLSVGAGILQKDAPKLVLLGCEVHGIQDESAIIVETGFLRMEGAPPAPAALLMPCMDDEVTV